MIARWIDWCARNRFLVFTGTLLLVLAGIWALRQNSARCAAGYFRCGGDHSYPLDGRAAQHHRGPGHLPDRHDAARGTTCQGRASANDVRRFLRFRRF